MAMVELRCTRYPQLVVVTPHGRVRFHQGVAMATAEQAEVVLGLPADRGIAAAEAPESDGGAQPEDGDGKPPARTATKTEWVAWAASQGCEDAEALTKAQLVERFG